MIQQTSKEIYLKIINNGLLNEMQTKVYDTIYNHGPITSNEVFMIHQMKTNQSGRFTELSHMGVIYEVEKRKCGITGNNSIAWNVTGNLPDKEKAKKYSSKNIILDKIVALGKQLSGDQRTQLLSIYSLVKDL